METWLGPLTKLATKVLVSENSHLPLVHCPIKLFLCCLCWQFCCFYLCLMTNTKMRNMKSQLGNLLISQIGLLCQGIAPVLSRYMQTDGDHDKRIEEDTQINWSESVYMYKCNISFLVPCVSSSDVINSRHLIKESISVVGQYVWSDFFFFVQRKTPRKYSMTVASCLIKLCYYAVTIANMTGWMSIWQWLDT